MSTLEYQKFHDFFFFLCFHASPWLLKWRKKSRDRNRENILAASDCKSQTITKWLLIVFHCWNRNALKLFTSFYLSLNHSLLFPFPWGHLKYLRGFFFIVNESSPSGTRKGGSKKKLQNNFSRSWSGNMSECKAFKRFNIELIVQLEKKWTSIQRLYWKLSPAFQPNLVKLANVSVSSTRILTGKIVSHVWISFNFQWW